MSVRLSVCIPTYNFAAFLPETLESIFRQDRVGEATVLVVDGASTDDTPEVIARWRSTHPNLRYVRLAEKGGIDRDMALTVAQAESDYCWLFSGDDLMRPGALARALAEIESGHDLYLCRHNEFLGDIAQWVEWPTLRISEDAVFDLADPTTRRSYFRLAVNTEAFFSFMSGLIVKRASWNRVALDEAFVGSCWAHVARFFALTRDGLTVKCLTSVLLDRRPGNDSFAGNGTIQRYRLAIEGFHRLGDAYFGHDSVEAREIRRVIRHEYHLNVFLLGRLLCELDPERESKALLDHLFEMAYGDLTWSNLRTRLTYARTSSQAFRRKNKHYTEEVEARVAARKAEAARRG